MLVNVSEATNVQIDWLVAKCEGFDALAYEIKRKAQNRSSWEAAPRWAPSTDWSQGGPIIGQMFAQGLRLHTAEYVTGVHNKNLIVASLDNPNGFYYGPTPLIAAMRCYIASKFGNEIDIPKELVNASI